MAEYIDKEKAIAIADKFGCNNGSCIGKHSGVADVIASLISDLPAADVAPVRHGRWLSWDELHGGNTLAKNVLGVFCSECIRQSDSKTNFCHNCGAKMDLEE